MSKQFEMFEKATSVNQLTAVRKKCDWVEKKKAQVPGMWALVWEPMCACCVGSDTPPPPPNPQPPHTLTNRHALSHNFAGQSEFDAVYNRPVY